MPKNINYRRRTNQLNNLTSGKNLASVSKSMRIDFLEKQKKETLRVLQMKWKKTAYNYDYSWLENAPGRNKNVSIEEFNNLVNLAANTVGVLTSRFTEFIKNSDGKEETKNLVLHYLGHALWEQKDHSKHPSRKSIWF